VVCVSFWKAHVWGINWGAEGKRREGTVRYGTYLWLSLRNEGSRFVCRELSEGWGEFGISGERWLDGDNYVAGQVCNSGD